MDGLSDLATIWGISTVFLLIFLIGGAFKFRNVEIIRKVSWPMRIIALLFCVAFFCGPFLWILWTEVPTDDQPPTIVRTETTIETDQNNVTPFEPTARPPTPVPPTPAAQASHPVLKGYDATIWNYPGGYVVFTTDNAGNQIFADYTPTHDLVSEGFWALDESYSPPILSMAGYDYQIGTEYFAAFEVLESVMNGAVTVDGVNTSSLQLTFTP